jgi:hypothetical protein
VALSGHIPQILRHAGFCGGGRENIPQPAKYYPPGFELTLLPFGEHTLRHFVYYERPEGMEHDASGLEVTSEAGSPVRLDSIVPQDQAFATVSHLYRGIERGLERLVEKYGERQLFVGPPEAQATQRYFRWPDLVPNTDLTSARLGIETIVEQGEGAILRRLKRSYKV